MLSWPKSSRVVLEIGLKYNRDFIKFPREVRCRGEFDEVEWIKFDGVHSQVILRQLYKVVIFFHIRVYERSSSGVRAAGCR